MAHPLGKRFNLKDCPQPPLDASLQEPGHGPAPVLMVPVLPWLGLPLAPILVPSTASATRMRIDATQRMTKDGDGKSQQEQASFHVGPRGEGAEPGGHNKTPTQPRGGQAGCPGRMGPQGNVVRCSPFAKQIGPHRHCRWRGRSPEGQRPEPRDETPQGARLTTSLRARGGVRRDASSGSFRVGPATLPLAFLASLARRPSRGAVGVLL